MTPTDAGASSQPLAAAVVLVAALLAVGGVVLSLSGSWAGFAAAWDGIARAAWLLPLLVGLHLSQLFLSTLGWRALLSGSGPGLPTFYRLRIIREGIDSLLPVAQVGGEIEGIRLLSGHGVPTVQAGASVIVDVTVELLTQIVFLVAGLAVLAWLIEATAWQGWVWSSLAGIVPAAIGLALAQRFGALRLLEGLLRGIARRWPALAGASLDGLHRTALAMYRDRTPLLICVAMHLPAWMLGSLETWAVLNAAGVDLSLAQAFAIESLGMAARSAGFAIPAALGAQEAGFVLAGAAVGVAAGPALALSFVKRLREVAVGSIGLLLWRQALRRKVTAG